MALDNLNSLFGRPAAVSGLGKPIVPGTETGALTTNIAAAEVDHIQLVTVPGTGEVLLVAHLDTTALPDLINSHVIVRINPGYSALVPTIGFRPQNLELKKAGMPDQVVGLSQAWFHSAFPQAITSLLAEINHNGDRIVLTPLDAWNEQFQTIEVVVPPELTGIQHVAWRQIADSPFPVLIGWIEQQGSAMRVMLRLDWEPLEVIPLMSAILAESNSATFSDGGVMYVAKLRAFEEESEVDYLNRLAGDSVFTIHDPFSINQLQFKKFASGNGFAVNRNGIHIGRYRAFDPEGGAEVNCSSTANSRSAAESGNWDSPSCSFAGPLMSAPLRSTFVWTSSDETRLVEIGTALLGTGEVLHYERTWTHEPGPGGTGSYPCPGPGDEETAGEPARIALPPGSPIDYRKIHAAELARHNTMVIRTELQEVETSAGTVLEVVMRYVRPVT